MLSLLIPNSNVQHKSLLVLLFLARCSLPVQRQKEAMEAHAAQAEKLEQGKRRDKLEAGFAEVCDALH